MMNRILTILAFAAVLTAFGVPALLGWDHHDEGLGSTHSACDGDCGCLCHAGMDGIVIAEIEDMPDPVTATVDSYQPPRPPSLISRLDRPPELSF
jgi:hypothetical protein